MRLFAAVDPPAEEVSALAAALAAAVPAGDRRLRQLAPEHWHVTLAFYGEVGDAVVPDLMARLGRAAGRTPAPTLRLAGAGTFPKRAAHARVLWAGLDGDLAVLTRLAERCVAAGRRAGIAMEDRAFRPHLTLGRASGRDPVDLRDVATALGDYRGAAWAAGTVRLVRSRLGPPLHHETLESWPLAPPVVGPASG